MSLELNLFDLSCKKNQKKDAEKIAGMNSVTTFVGSNNNKKTTTKWT